MLFDKNKENLRFLGLALLISVGTAACSSNLAVNLPTTGGNNDYKQGHTDRPIISRKQTFTKRACNIGAYVIDEDPQGLNVRSGPGTNYKVIAKLPTDIDIAEVEVRIAASVGNWVMITQAIDPGTDQIKFQGRGWVYAPLLGTSPAVRGQYISVYANPRKNSRKVGKIPSNTVTLTLNTCSGEWVKIEHKSIKGWLAPENQCPTLITNCS